MRTIGRVAALLAGLAASATAGEGVVTLATEPDSFGAWALDETTGAVYATVPARAQVVEFDPVTGARRRSFAAPSQEYGTSLLVKGRLLLVSDLRREGLAAFDLDSGELAFSLPIPGLRSPLMTAADRPEPWVWVVAGRDRELALVQLDLAQRAVVRRTSLVTWGADGQAGCVSRDGRLLLLRGSWSSSVFALEGRDGPWLVSATRDQEQGVGVHAGPCARSWVIGNRIASSDLSISMLGTRFENQPVLHPRRDLAFAASEQAGRRLDVFRASTGDELARSALGPNNQGRGSSLLVDGARDRVLCAWTGQAYVVDVSKVGTGPDLMLRADPPVVSVVAGESLTCDVAALDGASPAPALTLVEPPVGAVMVAGKLTWTPTNAQVGRHRLRVQGRRGEARDEVAVVVDVRRAAIALDFVVASMVVDADGKRVLASSSGGDSFPRDGAAEAKVALLDVAASSLLAQRSLGRDPRSLALASDGAYVLHQNPNTILRLKLPDLTDEKRSTHEGLMNLTAVGPRVVATYGQSFEAGVVVLDGSSFDEVWRLWMRTGFASPGSARTPDGGGLFGPALLGPDGRLRALVWPPNDLPSVAAARSATQQGGHARPRVRHPTLPVALSMTREHRADGTFVQLEVRDLVEDKVVMVLPVAVAPRNTPFPPSHMDWNPPIVGAGGHAVVGVGAAAYVVPLDGDALKKLAPRLEVTPAPAKPPVVRSDAAPVTVPVVATGGTGSYQFDLEGAVDGVGIDGATGAVTVDPVAVWKAFMGRITAGPFNWNRDAARSFLQALGSADAEAYPVNVHVSVRARDGEQQARTGLVVTVLGSADEVQRAVAAAAAAAAAARPAPAVADASGAAAALAPELQALRRAVEANRQEVGSARAAAAQATEAARAATAQATEVARAATEAARGSETKLEALRREVAVLEAAVRDGRVREEAARQATERTLGVAVAGVVLGIVALALGRRRVSAAVTTPAGTGAGPTAPT